MRSKTSEVALFAILGLLLGFTRIYYGGAEGLILVWKGEFSYADTLVNMAEMQALNREELVQQHPGVLYQLEEMGLYETDDNLNRTKPQKRPPEVSSEKGSLVKDTAKAPVED